MRKCRHQSESGVLLYRDDFAAIDLLSFQKLHKCGSTSSTTRLGHSTSSQRHSISKCRHQTESGTLLYRDDVVAIDLLSFKKLRKCCSTSFEKLHKCGSTSSTTRLESMTNLKPIGTRNVLHILQIFRSVVVTSSAISATGCLHCLSLSHTHDTFAGLQSSLSVPMPHS